VAYQIAAILMTLIDLQGHPPIASVFKCDFLYSDAATDKILSEISCYVALTQYLNLLPFNDNYEAGETQKWVT